MPVSVRWGSDRLQFDLPSPDTLLGAVRQSIAAYIHLESNAFHLVLDGAVMADDNAPIAAYHLRNDATITVVADSNGPVPQPPRNSENAQIAAIRAERAAVDASLLPAHAAFLRDLPIYNKRQLAKEHARIAELLLQANLRLDAIVPEHDWHAARADRKAAIKHLQALLDQLDAAWAEKV